MFNIRVGDSGKVVRKGLERLRRQIPLVSRKRLYDLAMEIKREMAVPGEAPTYPIQWDSDLQRRAFFATDGFGGGIPHKRTEQTQRAWQVIKFDDGYTVGNPLGHAGFVYGLTDDKTYQSNIHKGRWPLFEEVIARAVAKLPRVIRDAIILTAKDLGFKT